MKQCPYCHKQLNKQQVCQHCRLQVHFAVDPPSKNKQSQTQKTENDKSSEKGTKSIKKWIPFIIIGFITVLLLILFLLLRNFNSPEAQAKILVNAVDNNDTAKVSNLISTKQNKVGRQEAERYISYIKDEMGIKSFEKKVLQHVEQFDEGSPVSYVVKTDKNQEILHISKNGRRYLIFDNLSFQAPMKKAVLKPDTEATYEFSANDNKKKVMGKGKEAVEIGHYIPGDYVLDVTKTTSRGTYKGKLKFNTGSSDHDTVNVAEDFEETRVKVHLKNGDALDEGTQKVVINGETLNVTKDDTYGPFPLNKDLTITAQGEIQGKKFKASSQTIAEKDVKDSNEVTVAFDSEAIEKYKKEQEKDMKDKVSDFIKKYISARNKATQNNRIEDIKPYLLENTTFYKSMTSDLSKQKPLQDPQVTYINKSKNFYSVIVEADTKQGDSVRSHYLLQDGENDKNFKIVNYEAY
ncbi:MULTISPECIES: teicoplanin resistance protein VanZ [unclassified Staphylococcus]|uniref:TcaA second domain-containing protein n=1 Tax=unclassified Staphylococcus TaxID=91994 RepID=UPI0021D18FD3|nr:MULTISPECIES: teicoplanin resistance protein VanZ [unclassified Staphylococcus]UXR78081.1 teicoplanin resistance protein VanZ [Staphylococcus sp. IVB6227]UXR82244.1 teicoplanin resistance protein VanZ [Staphylococcus sp. IVB6214]